MEQAIAELENTMEEAEQYNQNADAYVEDLRSHLAAINEDIEIVERRRTADPELEKKSQEVTSRARRLKRVIERQINTIVRENTRGNLLENEEKGNAEIKFSKINLPIFDGQPANYQEFSDVFKKIIQKEKGMTELKKWLLLKQNVTGRAAEMIAYLPLAEESYATAMQIFKNTYAGKRRAITSLTQQLETLPAATTDTWNLRLTHSRIEGILMTLGKRGERIQENPFLVSLVMGKYPEEIRLKVIDDEDMTLEAFQAEVGRLIRIREGILSRVAKTPGEVVVNRTEQPKFSFNGRRNASSQVSSSMKNEQVSRNYENKTGKSNEQIPTQNKEVNSNNREMARGQKRNNTRAPVCIYCEKEHWSDECPEFATITARKKKIADRCTICLRKKHEGVVCIKLKRCVHCQENTHHRSLCPKKFSTKQNNASSGGATPGGAASTGPRTEFLALTAPHTGFFTLMLEASGLKGKKKKVRAVIDTAGGRTLVTEELAKSLGVVKREQEKVTLKGVGREPTALECSGSVRIKLHPPDGQILEINAQVVDYITDDLPAPDIDLFRRNHPECANMLIPGTGQGKKIDLLLGRDNLFDVLTLEKSVRVDENAQLMSTVFGWLVLEKQTLSTPEKRRKIESINLLLRTEDAVKRLWELDCVGLKEVEAADVEMEQRALEQFYANIKFKEGRYEVAWPYAENETSMQTSFGLAWGRLRSLHRKLSTDETLLNEYDRLIRTQIADGITEEVNGTNAKNCAVIRYIPHQAVIKPGKSTPVRIVYDASAKCGKLDRSLNDCMVKGLNWVPDLTSALLRFRKNTLAVTADIERAFHQIAIREQDRDAVRYLWLKEPKKPPNTENIWILRFKRMAFGIVASPFLLAATIKYHLRSRPYKFAEMVESEMYADNLVISLKKNVAPAEFYQEVKKIFADMSMNLTSWATNAEGLRKVLAAADAVPEKEQMVLGMKWLTYSDELMVKEVNSFDNEHATITKRKALRELASVFDPMGWLAPATLLAKLYIRELWEQKYAWDAELDTAMQEKWRIVAEAIKNETSIQLPRRYFCEDLEDMNELKMHLFVDASKNACAAVIYLSARNEKKNTVLAFVAAKNRLAPRKTLTIPRLELLALLIGSKYAEFVKKSWKTKKDIPLIIWTDSKCVLSWVKNNKLLPTVIEKQIKQIKQVRAEKYNYVPSIKNPADVASRGASIRELKNQNWWQGPEWLKDEKNWPQQQPLTDEEERQAVEEEKIATEKEHERVLLLTTKESRMDAMKTPLNAPFTLNPSDFSTLNSLLRRTAWCTFCLDRLLEQKTKKKLIKRENIQKDYKYAREMWIKWDQHRAYPQAFQKGAKLTGELKSLRLAEDENGLLRCQTRMLNAEIPDDAKRPILLVRGSPLTNLIIMSAHLKSFHAGTSQTLAEIRREYWLPRGRQQIFHVLRKQCMTCRRYNAKPYQAPEAPPLPESRVKKTSRVFECIGLDIFGPFIVKENQERKAKRKKVWIVIFTCLVVRAVHFEIMVDMSSVEFLMAFRRFAARRGVPGLVVSDNAPQFHVVEGKFQRLWHALEENEKINEYFASNEIVWEFIPQSVPWMGGAYERLIRSAKNAFERTYGRVIQWIRQFEVAVAEVEAVVNSRPLTYIGKEDDARIITPNSFLKVKHTAIPVKITEEEAREKLAGLWKSSEDYLNVFWREWADHYIAMIKERDDKLRQAKGIDRKEPEKGDLVLLVESDKKRSSWTLAVVEKLIESKDGKSRSALIKIPNGARTIRPLAKLAPMHLKREVETGENLQLNRQRTVIVHDDGEQSEEEIVLGPQDL